MLIIATLKLNRLLLIYFIIIDHVYVSVFYSGCVGESKGREQQLANNLRQIWDFDRTILT